MPPAVFASAPFGAEESERPSLSRLLSYYDQHYDPEARLLKVPFRSTGYHSKISNGTSVHPIRESFYYTVALFQRGGRQDVSRANAILREVLRLQEADPESKSYGVWPWLSEEPLEKMESVDLNWSDFCGSAIAQILVKHRDQLNDQQLVQQTESALRHATTAIRRRDVGPGYTNIAVLGGGVCAVAGEVLNDADLLGYGRRRLTNVVALTERLGGFTEYNSPTYGKVIIGECERILYLAQDSAVRKAAESIRIAAWRMVSDSFHFGTQQWAGPHSRLTQRRLTDTLVMFLNDRTGIDIQPHPRADRERPRGYGIVPPIPCPAKLRQKIKRPVKTPTSLNRTFRIDDQGRPLITGTTWISNEACLGSVNRSSFWLQRNPIAGYWRTDDDPAVAFRVRFLCDGKDFASMGIRTVQRENRILFVVHSLQNRGSWHRTLDRPANGKFKASDFRLQLELDGKAVAAKELPLGRFAIGAGGYEVVVLPAKSEFQGSPVRWEAVNGEHRASIEAVCYSGPKKQFDFNAMIKMQLAAAIILQALPERVEETASPEITQGADRVDVRWDGLRTAAPQ